MLVGLQLPTVVDGLGGLDCTASSCATAALIAATVIVVAARLGLPARLPAADALPPDPRARARPPWQETLVIGWTGMRGAVSLAAALALPFDDRRRRGRSPIAS